jgi:PAS domain S-box-containing protein
MKLRSQLILSIIVFGIVLLAISASVVITNQQVAQVNNKEQTANNINTGASNLAYIANDYFLYRQSAQLNSWQAQFSSLLAETSNLTSINPEQIAQIQIVTGDLQRLGTVFNSSVSILQSIPQNESASAFPAFQTASGRLNIQNQALAFDASVLSNSFANQADQLKQTNSILIFALLGAFGAYFVMIYFIVFRRTFRSIAKLQEGTKIIGSGNLDYSIASKSDDEIGELSLSFNQMTANLRNVTASKTDLGQVQASLRESEQRWATTLASIGDAVIATDLSGNITFMNGEAEALTGWTLSEASRKLVKEVFNIVNEQTRLEVENPVEKVLKEGIVCGLANHTILIRKDHSEIPIDDSGAPIKDKDGKTSGVVLIFRDITERKKAEEALNRVNQELEERVQKRTQEVSNERQRLYNVLETLPAYVVLLDKDYRMPFANKVFRETFGESYGRRCYDFLFDKKSECDNCITYKVLKTNKSQHWEWTGPNGHDYEIYDYPFAEADGSTLILEMGIDVTDRKKAERQAKESANKLKDSERLAAIGATAGMVGHDIRNPLQAITGDLFLAKTELATLPENEQKVNALESLEEIQHNIDYINKIVADLQDYARPLNPRTQETNIKSLFNEILTKNGIPKNISVTVEVDDKAEKIMADPDYLKRIAANLTLNAVQAMPNGGKLTIRAYADKQTNDTVITVEDTGVGIPEDIKPKLFTPMMTTKSKGQGFGLAVVKRMSEGLGGTVTFESTEGKGTTFIVRLPQRAKR